MYERSTAAFLMNEVLPTSLQLLAQHVADMEETNRTALRRKAKKIISFGTRSLHKRLDLCPGSPHPRTHACSAPGDAYLMWVTARTSAIVAGTCRTTAFFFHPFPTFNLWHFPSGLSSAFSHAIKSVGSDGSGPRYWCLYSACHTEGSPDPTLRLAPKTLES